MLCERLNQTTPRHASVVPLTRNMNLRHLLLTCVALLVCACSSPIPLQSEVLQNKVACCTDIGQLPVAGVLESSPISVDLDERVPVYEFSEGRSYFAVFELPASRSGATVELHTWHQGNSKFDAHIFCPVISALDSNKRLQKALNLGPMEFTRAGLIDNARFTTTFEVPVGVKYLAIHTPHSMIGKSLSTVVNRQGAMIFVGSSVYSQPGGPQLLQIPCAPHGKVTLSVK